MRAGAAGRILLAFVAGAILASPSYASRFGTAFDARVAQIRDGIARDPALEFKEATRLHADAGALPEDVRGDARAMAEWLRADALISLNQPKQAERVIEQ